TIVGPGQLLRSVRIPEPPPGTAIAHRKIAFRERPAATVAAAIRVEGGTVVGASIAVGSVGPRPVRATAASELLVGRSVADTEAIVEAAALASEASNAVEDANGSVEYKEQLVRVLFERCVASAVGNTGDR